MTDNKAVELIFGNARSKPKARIERWCLRLLPYKFVIRHKPGSTNIADYLSRNPLASPENQHAEMAELYVNQITATALPKAISEQVLIDATSQDVLLQEVKNMIMGKKCDVGRFGPIRDELSVTSTGIILKGNLVVIPSSLIKQVVKLAHAASAKQTRTRRDMSRFR